jgi:hypothetical protein
MDWAGRQGEAADYCREWPAGQIGILAGFNSLDRERKFAGIKPPWPSVEIRAAQPMDAAQSLQVIDSASPLPHRE